MKTSRTALRLDTLRKLVLVGLALANALCQGGALPLLAQEPAAVRGRLQDASGAPVARALVELKRPQTLYDEQLDLLEGRQTEPVAQARTDGKGRFELEVEELGLWQLSRRERGCL